MPLFPGMTEHQLKQELAVWPLDNLHSLSKSLERHFANLDKGLEKVERCISRVNKHLYYWQNQPIAGLSKIKKIIIVQHKLDEYLQRKQEMQKEKLLCEHEHEILHKLLSRKLLRSQQYG